MHATTAAEWAQMTSLAVALYASCSAPYFLLVEAEVWAWPRPLTAALDRVLATSAGVRLVVAAFNAKADARETVADFRQFAALSLRDAAVSVAALLALLTITSEHR